jgi:hypothetical protein
VVFVARRSLPLMIGIGSGFFWPLRPANSFKAFCAE